jgi:hypothetical protein
MHDEQFEMRFDDDVPAHLVAGRIEFHRELFKANWDRRHASDPDWARRYRHYARHAIGELRYLTGRPRKNIMFGLNRTRPY